MITEIQYEESKSTKLIESAQYFADELCDSDNYYLDDYDEWTNTTFSLADLGEEGREIFHQLSETSIKYDKKVVDKKFDNALKSKREGSNGKRTIKSFFYEAIHDYMILPPNSDLKAIKEIEEKVQFEYGKEYYTASELLERNIESVPTLLDPLFQKVGVAGIAGSSDTGKSSFLRQLAVAVSLGDDNFLGWKLNTTHKKAIYISTEDGDEATSALLHKNNTYRKLKPIDYNGLTFIFNTTDLLKKVELMLEKTRVDLIVIDTFTDIYGRSMNDANQIRFFLDSFSQLAQKYRCLFIFLHHTGKRSEDLAPSKNNILGSQGFESKMRLVIELKNDFNEPNKKHLCIVKANYLPKDYKTESYVLNFNAFLLFEQTNERCPFDELKVDNKKDIKELVKKMHEEGKTQKIIAKKLGLSQGTVSNYLKGK